MLSIKLKTTLSTLLPSFSYAQSTQSQSVPLRPIHDPPMMGCKGPEDVTYKYSFLGNSALPISLTLNEECP